MSSCIEYLIRNRKDLRFSHPVHGPEYPNQGMFELDKMIEEKIYTKGGDFKIGDRDFRAVIWQPHAITTYPMGSRDTMSFDFAGCVMAAYENDGTWHAAHIHMGDRGSLRAEWSSYMNSLLGIEDLIMFCPDDMEYDAVRAAYLKKYSKEASFIQVAGLITNRKECYTLYLNSLDRHETIWELIGYKAHLPARGREKYAGLLEPDTEEKMKTAWNDYRIRTNTGRVVYAWDVKEYLRTGSSEEDEYSGGCCCC